MKVIAYAVLLFAGVALACTNFLVTPGASVTGSSMISYAADSGTLYGALYHNAHATHPNGTMMDVIEWDTGKYLGQIPQAPETYNTIGNTNEYGLAIGETTFGGLPILCEQKGAIIDYGSLIYIALQRAKTAREAISVMTDLVAKYGYASEGESFSIADNNEVWVLEMIGKGNLDDGKKGAVWVARRVPDGHVTAHANQARITTFPRNDPDNCIYSEDVVSFAKKNGLYDGPDEDFSFSDVYNPLDFVGARACEMRAWSFFRSVVGADVMDEYCDYVEGGNLTHRMEWSYKPAKKLAATDLMRLLRDHLEGTKFDFSQDIGAGPFNMPYRWRPMTWEVNGQLYINERSTSTQQTAFVFVAELRKNVPDFMIAKNWFGVDDAACTVFAPMFGSNTEVPEALVNGGVANIMNVSLDSSFWVFNLVANLAYTKWRIVYPEVINMSNTLEQQYINSSAEAERVALELYQNNETERAVQYLTNYSKTTAQNLHDVWKDFFEYLVTRHIDGFVKTYVPGKKNPSAATPGYGEAWYRRIIADAGDKYLVPEDHSSSSSTKPVSSSVKPVSSSSTPMSSSTPVSSSVKPVSSSTSSNSSNTSASSLPHPQPSSTASGSEGFDYFIAFIASASAAVLLLVVLIIYIIATRVSKKNGSVNSSYERVRD